MFISRVARAFVVAALAIGLGFAAGPQQAQADPLSEKVIIPAPCSASNPYDPAMSMTELRDGIAQNWGFQMVGSYWIDPTYRPLVKVIWQTLDAISCTPFLDTVHATTGGQLSLNATVVSGWPAGDYGLTKGNSVSLDFPQLLTSYQTDPGHVARLFVHELTHAYSLNRGDNPSYWVDFNRIYAKNGRFSNYGSDASEVLSEVVGFYVARCAANNPYAPSENDYYQFAKKIFGGKEFGPALGQPLVCDSATLAAQDEAKYAPAKAVAKAVSDQRAAVEQQQYAQAQAVVEALAKSREEARRQIESAQSSAPAGP